MRSFFFVLFSWVLVTSIDLKASQSYSLKPTHGQQQAISALIETAIMQSDPFFAERDLLNKQNQESLQRALNKRAEDLTPPEQWQLMMDTIYLNFADGYLAENVFSIASLWATMACAEYCWRTYCRYKGDVETKTELICQPLNISSNPTRDKATSTGGLSIAESMIAELKEGFLSGEAAAFLHRFPSLGSFIPPYYAKLLKDKMATASVNEFEQYREKFYKDYHRGENVLAYPKHIYGTRAIQDAGKWTTRAFAWGETAKTYLPVIMVILPSVRRIINYIIDQRAISYGHTPRKFLEDALKALPATPKLWRDSEKQENPTNLLEALSDRRTSIHIANTIIKPAWNKHHGNAEKVWAELAAQGNLALHLARSVDPNDEQSLYRFVMALHGGVLPSLKPTRLELAKKAFEHHMLKRIVLSAVAAVLIPVLASTGYLFTNHQWIQFCEKAGLLFAFVPAIFSVILGSSSVYFTAKGLFARDNAKARADYATFLKRLHLEGAAYGEQFYWSWFLPFWKLHSGDILELETLFKARAQEVMEKYTALKAFEAAENPAPEAQPQAPQQENDSYKEAFARAEQAFEQDQAAAQATSEAAQQSTSPESSLSGDTAAPTPETSQPVTTHPQSQELLIPIIV